MKERRRQVIAAAMAATLVVSTMTIVHAIPAYAQETNNAQSETSDMTMEAVASVDEETMEPAQDTDAEKDTAEDAVPQAETEVEINEANFPDEAFRKYLGEHFDYDNNKSLSQDEIKAVTVINVGGNETIKDLTGISYFKSLKTLECWNTQISSLDVSQNPALKELACSHTGVSSLDVSQNPALEELFCDSTGISSLNVSQNPALWHLQCSDTQISSLDVSQNPALEELVCSDTGVSSLDVSKNPALRVLQCSDTQISSLDLSKNPALEDLYCSSTGISSLDVSQNPALSHLQCSDTQISSLDMSRNPALDYLSCDSTGISSLDVSQNPALGFLSCDFTGISSLDVSQNPALRLLSCDFTGISSLNVSKNPALRYLYCDSTGISSLNLGTKEMDEYRIGSPRIELEVDGASFDITKKLEILDVNKIQNISGATLNGNIVSGYSLDTPINYEYDCGTDNGVPVLLKVTLNLTSAAKGESTITINKDLDRIYTGTPVSLTAEDCTTTGSDGAITFVYYKQDADGSWKELASAPVDAGNYKVTAKLEESESYKGAVSEEKQFEITRAANKWTENLTIKGWKFGEKPNTPSAVAQYGVVTFTYSAKENGEYTKEVPAKAGTWYVKAVVEGTDNYEGLTDVKSFKITQVPEKAPAAGGTAQGAQKKPVAIVKPVAYVDHNQKNYAASPKTGDSSSTSLWGAMSLLSGGFLVLLMEKKYRKAKAENNNR